MSISSVARTLRNVYAEQGTGGLLAVTHYYLARTQALVAGPGRTCPLCGWSGPEFIPLYLPSDRYVRRGAVCPSCGARERQRAWVPMLERLLAREYGDRRVDILQFSPDASATKVLLPHARSYRASNYVDPAPGELQLDLLDLALADEDVDLAVMTYVLCCVPDDRRAARNLWRVLRRGGMVLACEGFAEGEHHVEWGAPRHGGTWRQFGVADVRERFAPFEVTLIDAVASLSPEERRRRGVAAHEYVLVLRKPG